MGLLRNLILSAVPQRVAADMEAESRQWILTCSKCGSEASIWDIGGLRWKAAGHPWKWIPCQSCGRWTWHRTHRRPQGSENESPPSADGF